MKRIGILGSTGSIGTQALALIEEDPASYEVTALSCGRNIRLLMEQINRFEPKLAVVENESDAAVVREYCADRDTEIMSGMEGLLAVARSEADILLTSLVGSIGLLPTLAGIEAGKTIALANKETLVTAGRLVMDRARQRGAAILPVDSEHSAIFQCLQGNRHEDVDKLILTASGGPFRSVDRAAIAQKRAADALKHPNWCMGAKITIDSATMMNKGLEVIEARWLFDIPEDRIDVVVHPQSIIHSMIQYRDSSVMAQMGLPDMRLPIHYAFNYPGRHRSGLPKMDFAALSALTFEAPDMERFPCLALAYTALEAGGTMPCVMNAANEEMVARYLAGNCSFYDISEAIAQVMECHDPIQDYSVDDLLMLDREARRRTGTSERGRF